MTHMPDNRVKHLEMIQSIISRMAGESARMKQFGLTVVGILASISKTADAPSLALVGFALTIFFWLLDSQYLHQERLYRTHYDEIRQEPGEADFRMSLSDTARANNSRLSAIFGWSTCLLYGALLAICLFLAFGLEVSGSLV